MNRDMFIIDNQHGTTILRLSQVRILQYDRHSRHLQIGQIGIEPLTAHQMESEEQWLGYLDQLKEARR